MNAKAPTLSMGITFDGSTASRSWSTNGDLIAAVAGLGWLHAHDRTLDATYGTGQFWTRWQPRDLMRCDLEPAKSPDWPNGLDATAMPAEWTSAFDAVVLDPPYKLNGTDQGEGDRYGVAGDYSSVGGRHDLAADMLAEGARVLAPGGTLLFKCQDQTNGGRRRWQARLVANFAERLGLEQVDLFVYPSYRPQPERSTCTGCGQKIMRRADGRWGTVKRDAGDAYTCTLAPVYRPGHVPSDGDNGQALSHINYSILLVFKKPTGRQRIDHVGAPAPTDADLEHALRVACETECRSDEEQAGLLRLAATLVDPACRERWTWSVAASRDPEAHL